MKLFQNVVRASVSSFAFLMAFEAVADLAASADAPLPQGVIHVSAINHMTIRVADVDRSVKWYRGLFGLSVVGRLKGSVVLRIGEGPRYLTIVDAGESEPGIAGVSFSVQDFDADRTLKVLKARGVAVLPKRGMGIRFKDPAGIVVRLTGGSRAGSGKSTERSRSQGALELRDYNHFTIFVPDAKGQVKFYRNLFELGIDTHQGPMPIIRVGQGNQFLAFVGGRSNAFVHHACFVVDDFDPERILATLADHGVKPRAAGRGPAGPLKSYVVMRMPNRGGAPGGTPELYLTDPDGILLQIQDTRYAGGGGYLGDHKGSA